MNNLVDIFSVITAITAFCIFLVVKTMKSKELNLEDIVMVIIAGGTLPITIAIVVYPFFPEFIGSIEDMSLQIALMGLVLLFVYVKIFIQKIFSQ